MDGRARPQPGGTRAGPRLCLSMIVKDEEAILQRCLESLAPEIGHWVVCDTGSSDGTRDLVRSFFARAGIPGSLHEIPFVDFGTTRNRALELCRQEPAEFDYILLCDADMELQVEDPGYRERLRAAAYLVPQRNDLTYVNVRLLRRDVSASYVGATHEYLSTPEPPERLEGLSFFDHACGSSRSEKTERDLRLLAASLEESPDDPRSLFYLAQTFFDAGRHAEAVHAFERRIAAGGWEEEVWYARYRLALCRKALGDVPGFVAGCLDAYSSRPWRAEPLAQLARHYRETGQSDACLAICEIGSTIPWPSSDRLFVEDRAHTTAFAEETSISGYYSALPGRRAKGRQVCFALAVDRRAPEGIRRTARGNSLFYAPDAQTLLGGCSRKEIEIGVEPPFHAMNPSVAVVDGLRRAVVRTVNYTIVNGRYVVADPDGVIRTRNRLVTLDAAWDVVDDREMIDLTGGPRHPFPVSGFEDCRLFAWRGGLWCSATARDLNAEGQGELVLLGLDGEGRFASAHVQRAVRPDWHQKNWVPIVRGEELFFLYTTDPTVVLKVDPATCEARFLGVTRPAISLAAARGGSQALRVADGWLYLVHEAVDGPNGRRSYLHRFVLLDDDLRVVRATDPFHFFGPGIEFAAGLARDPSDGRLVVSVGIGDERACLAFLTESGVRAALTLDAVGDTRAPSRPSPAERGPC